MTQDIGIQNAMWRIMSLTLAQGGQMTQAQNLSGAHLSRCNTAAAVVVATIVEAALATMAAAMAIAVAAVA